MREGIEAVTLPPHADTRGLDACFLHRRTVIGAGAAPYFTHPLSCPANRHPRLRVGHPCRMGLWPMRLIGHPTPATRHIRPDSRFHGNDIVLVVRHTHLCMLPPQLNGSRCGGRTLLCSPAVMPGLIGHPGVGAQPSASPWIPASAGMTKGRVNDKVWEKMTPGRVGGACHRFPPIHLRSRLKNQRVSRGSCQNVEPLDLLRRF